MIEPLVSAPEPPHTLVDCPACCGEGQWEISAPSWNDPYGADVVRCEACFGSGGFIKEDSGDRPDDPELRLCELECELEDAA